MKFAFRTDASIRIGTGHVARCLNLANALHARGHTITFICGEHPGHRGAVIEAAGYALHLLPRDEMQGLEGYEAWLGATIAQDATQTIASLQGEAPDWLITDHYALDATWHRTVREALGCRIMVIDDLANRAYDADILLDQNFHLTPEKRYTGRVPETCLLFLGPRYALLKPDFFVQPPLLRHHAQPKRLFLFFGGIDATGETLRALTALTRIPHALTQIDVVCGSANPQLSAIREQCSIHGYTLHIDTPHMAGLIAGADLGIGGGGVNTWERCFLHLPTLVITVAENQEPSMAETSAAGLVCYLGRSQSLSDMDLQAGIAAFITDTQGRTEIAAHCAQLFGQSGMAEVVNQLTHEP